MSSTHVRHIRALWFGDEDSLLGHLHTPLSASLDVAVVICPPPFGYENVCGHRGLRILGDRLAESGIASLRFDFPGTGDSDGEHDLQAWKAAVTAAVTTVRLETGCGIIAIIGVGLAGTVALASIDDGLNVDKIILWGTPTRARIWLRQQRAYQQLASLKADPTVPPPPRPPEGIEEISGFPLEARLAGQLASLDVSRASADMWPVDRPRPAALVVARMSADLDGDLGGALTGRGIASRVEMHDGFDQMFDEPHLSKAPDKIFARMRDWLVEGVAKRESRAAEPNRGPSVSTRIGNQGMVRETARYSQGDGGLLFSIETRPANRECKPTWLVFLTGRAVRHIGPNRMWVRFARELAKAGYASLRLDGRSVGDSDGEGDGLMPNAEYYQEHIYDDVERVMDIAVAQGARQFLMTGICSGATASYQVAWRRSDVRAIVLLNLLQLRHDPEDDERAKVQLARSWGFRKELWANPKSYLRLLKGELPSAGLLKMIFNLKTLLSVFDRRTRNDEPNYIVTGFRELASKPVDIDIFLSEGDLSVLFLERHFGVGLPGFEREHLRVHRVHNTDHTIRALFAQERFFGILRDALARIT